MNILSDINVDTITKFKQITIHQLPAIQSETDTLTILQKLQLAEVTTLKKGSYLTFWKRPTALLPGSLIKIGMFASDVELLSDDNIQGNLFE